MTDTASDIKSNEQLLDSERRANMKRDDPLRSVGLPSASEVSSDKHLNRPSSSTPSMSSGSGSSLIAKNLLSKKEYKPRKHQDEDNLLLDEGEVKYIKEAQMHEQSKLSMLRTILDYIKSDITKKKRSFKIGVFTIFLVVTFIMLLKSIVDVAPVAFLKVG